MARIPQKLLAAILCLTGLLATPGCANADGTVLNVSAASSLTDAITEINTLYAAQNPSTDILINFASSGTLQQQIENGAPCDVFLSAATTQMDILQNKGLLLDETRRNFVSNSVVLIVPQDSTLGLSGFQDLTGTNVHKIAIGDPASVPAGKYARQVFESLGLYSALQTKLVLASNVRQVLAYVETGDVEAGIVYATDTLISDRVKIVASAPPEINAEIVYPAAVIKASIQPQSAREYLDFLASDAAKNILIRYGFTPVAG